ncbi:MAG TPA: glycosyltransferase [Opitutaceae bacterium]|nr:glycosyltransferase [Opitutaceae bacterium]
MIYFDVTKTAKSRHRSGLMRVSQRLSEELGDRVLPIVWAKDGWTLVKRKERVALLSEDWILTPELFSELERPGFWHFLHGRECRLAAIFHDAIPLKMPQTTWPQSVARHPEYMKMLASFDRVFPVSRSSASELEAFWAWQGAAVRARVSPITLGADMAGETRVLPGAAKKKAAPPLLLCLGILEPRKNQMLVLDVAESLLRERVDFRLEIVGRVNPHFGREIERRTRELAKAYPQIRYRSAVGDRELLELWGSARATLFPTVAEGCGLPLLESLWMGVPCVCSDLPVLRENGDRGGCDFVPLNDRGAWTQALRKIIGSPSHVTALETQIAARELPTWRGAADAIVEGLGDA